MAAGVVGLTVVVGSGPKGDRTRRHPQVHSLQVVAIGWLTAVAALSVGVLLQAGVLLPLALLGGTSPFAVRRYGRVIAGGPAQSGTKSVAVQS